MRIISWKRNLYSLGINFPLIRKLKYLNSDFKFSVSTYSSNNKYKCLNFVFILRLAYPEMAVIITLKIHGINVNWFYIFKRKVFQTKLILGSPLFRQRTSSNMYDFIILMKIYPNEVRVGVPTALGNVHRRTRRSVLFLYLKKKNLYKQT